MADDLRTLRELIREALDRVRLSPKDLEDELGIGHGNLAHLLSGRLELRVRHLLSIARLLKVPPHQFLELGCPEATRAAARDLAVLVGRAKSASDLAEDRIRAIVRDELARHQSNAPAAVPAPKKKPTRG